MEEQRVVNFDGIEVRVYGSPEEPWFVAKDVAKVLDLPSYRNVLSKIDTDEKGVVSINTLGGNQEISVVSEAGLYFMIFQSRKAEAVAFRKWVCKELLPTLRREGKYELEKQILGLETRLIEKSNELEKVRELKDDDENIKLSDRIVDLELIPKRVIDKLLYGVEKDVNGRRCIVQHPDNKNFRNRLLSLSVRLSNAKEKYDGKRPDMIRNGRTNLYTLSDYKRFGDKLIKDYFTCYPFEDWGLNVDWDFEL